MSSFFSRLTAAVTVGVGGAFAAGLLNNKAATYIALGAAILQAFQRPVQNSSADNAVAANAIAATKPNA